MLSLLLIIVLVASIIMLIFAVSNYIKDKKERQKSINMLVEQHLRRQEYYKMYNECKKKQQELKELED